MNPGEPFCQVGHIWIGEAALSQFLQHPEMPIGKRAIADTVEYTQYEPGCAGKQEGKKVQSTRFLPYPSEKVKNNQGGMENDKKDIEKMVHC